MASDQVIIAVATGILSLISSIFTGIMTYMMTKLKMEVRDVHEKTSVINKKVDDAAVNRKIIHEEALQEIERVKEVAAETKKNEGEG